MKSETQMQAGTSSDPRYRVESAAACGACGYRLRGLPATVSVCPECGAPVDPSTYEPPAWFGDPASVPGLTTMELPGYVLGAAVAALLADAVRRVWGGFGIEFSPALMAGGLGLAAALFLVALKRFGLSRIATLLRASFGSCLVAFGVVTFFQGLLLMAAIDRLPYGLEWLLVAMLLGAGIAYLGHAFQTRTGRAVRRTLAESADICVK